MIPNKTIKPLFSSAVQTVTSHIQDYSVRPEKDFSRIRKFPADRLITFLVAQGASSTRAELIDFFGLNPDAPTSSAFRQQRAKLKPEALKETFDLFNASPWPVHSCTLCRCGVSLSCCRWLLRLFLQYATFLSRCLFCLRGAFHERLL